MSKLLRLVMILPLVFIFSSFTYLQNEKEAVGKITFPLNRVFVIPAGSSGLQYAQFNMDVYAGDKIETKRSSRCEITLISGDVVRIDENSIYTLEAVKADSISVQTSSFLSIGKLWANIKKVFSEDDYFKVKSPSAVIAVRGTIYRVDANKDTTTQVVVYDGEVAVSPEDIGPGQAQQAKDTPPPSDQNQQVNPPQEVAPPREVAPPQEVSVGEWLQIVKAQQQIYVRPDGSYEQQEFDPVADAKLDWVKWNKKRDKLIQRGR